MVMRSLSFAMGLNPFILGSDLFGGNPRIFIDFWFHFPKCLKNFVSYHE